MMNVQIPDAPVVLNGFPTCAHPHSDGREVEKAGELCRLDGGKPATLEIIRRSIHRQIRLALRQILLCGPCREIPPNEARCGQCAWMRGAAMGMVGIGEQIWGDDEFAPYLEIICVYDPGWQKRVDWK